MGNYDDITPAEREEIKREAGEMWEAIQGLSREDLSKQEAKRAEGRAHRVRELFEEKGWFGSRKAPRVALLYVQEMFGISAPEKNILYRGSPISSDTAAGYSHDIADAVNRDQGYDPDEYDLESTDFRGEDTTMTPGHRYLINNDDIIREFYGR